MIIKIEDKKINEYVEKIHNKGGTCYLVGGYVRDKVLLNNTDNSDIDIEVHNIEYQELLNIFQNNGKVQGNFGVIKLLGTTAEFAMPRNENKIGQKHNEFMINMNPYMDLKSAAKRRDFTINTLMYNLKEDILIDNYGAMNDIKSKLIRHTSDKFTEDPLRILRAIRFSFKLNFKIANDTLLLCESILNELDYISKERKNEEVRKLITAHVHNNGLQYLYKLLFKYYGIDNLHNITQNPLFHPEGNVWIHTKQALMLLDYERDELSKDDYYIVFLSLLFHDIGKIKATGINEDGSVHSHGHEQYSYHMSQKIIEDIEIDKRKKKIILNLIRDHMKPIFINEMRSKTVIELFEFYKDDIKLLLYVFLFDKSARSKECDIQEMNAKFLEIKKKLFEPVMEMYEYYEGLKKIYNGKYFMERGITGKDIGIKQKEVLIKQMSIYRK